MDEFSDLTLEDSRYVLKGQVKNIHLNVSTDENYKYQPGWKSIVRAEKYTISAEFVPDDKDVAYRIYEKELAVEAVKTVTVTVKERSLKAYEEARVRVGAPVHAEVDFMTNRTTNSVTFSWRENV